MQPRTHVISARRTAGALLAPARRLLNGLNGHWHRRALLLYASVVTSHFLEHALQMAQVHALGWSRPEAGGLLGLAFPGIAAAEVLHTTWNSLQLTGLILLLIGFRRIPAARSWWLVALTLQTWHWFEHAVIQLQYVTGIYLYGAMRQMSILERFAPRIELHFMYNVAVFIPTLIAFIIYFRHREGAVPRTDSATGVRELNPDVFS
jgi:hypothetical protein